MVRQAGFGKYFSRAISAAWILGVAGIVGTALSMGCGTATPTDPSNPSQSNPGAATRDAIDFNKVKWLIGDVRAMEVSKTVNFQITSFTDHEFPTVCYKANTESWWPDASGITNGSLYVIIEENGVLYGAGIEYNLTGTNGRCSTMENYLGEPPFIQGKIPPVNTYYPKSGETVYFMLTSLIPEWHGGAGPRERSQIVKAIFP